MSAETLRPSLISTRISLGFSPFLSSRGLRSVAAHPNENEHSALSSRWISTNVTMSGDFTSVDPSASLGAPRVGLNEGGKAKENFNGECDDSDCSCTVNFILTVCIRTAAWTSAKSSGKHDGLKMKSLSPTAFH